MMLKVGEFARLAQVSVRLLHHYDKLGLLSPTSVDRTSGYRYYSADQLPRLHRILALKELGLSLEQVGYLINNPLSSEELHGMLLLKQAELCQRVAEEQARLDRVRQRLRFIEQEGKLPDIEVIVKPVPALTVLSLRRATRPPQTPHHIFYEAVTVLRKAGLRGSVEAIIGRYHAYYLTQLYVGASIRRNLFEAAYAFPDDQPLPSDLPTEYGGHVRLRRWPAVENMACVIYRGADRERHLAHHALIQWLPLQGYTLDGPQREVYLWRAEPDLNSDQHVTELQYPLRKIDIPV